MKLEQISADVKNCLSLVGKPWSIEDSSDSTYNCAIVGGSGTPIWGSVFYFTISLDQNDINHLPTVKFAPGLNHPLIDSTNGLFYQPQDICINAYSTSMEKYLDTIYSLLILDIPLTSPHDPEIYQTFQANPSKFWAVLRQQALQCLDNDTQHE